VNHLLAERQNHDGVLRGKAHLAEVAHRYPPSGGH
jgi:hypothetical protein